MRVEIGPILRTDFRAQGCYSKFLIDNLIQMPVRMPTSSLGLGYHFLLFYRTHSYNYVCRPTGYSRPCHTELKHEAFSENVILVWPTCRTPAVGGLIVCVSE